MSTISFQANSTTLILNGTSVSDFVDGDILELVPVNSVTEHVNGSNGSVSIQKRSDFGVHDLKVRPLKFSNSDIFLSNLLEQDVPVVFNGSMKENFVKDGVDGVESWLIESGSFTVRPTSIKNNQTGNSLMEYTIRFRNCTRSI